ncbi:MAG TPA: DUF433 domain-containing protein, partial [Ktedonobacterales bacterium]|nr:DUF433 domain-containing protein [Ktedonobacterales bacterium]
RRRDHGEGRQVIPMLLEDYFEFEEDTGAIRIKGHRVWLEHVVRRFKEGLSPEQIWEDLDTLTLEEIYASVLYYLRNRAQVDAYIAALDRDFEERRRESRANPSPIARRMMALLAQKREQEAHENPLPAR